LSHFKWHILPSLPDEQLSHAIGVPPFIAQLLCNRGLRQPSDVEVFLSIDNRLSGDPFLLPDMHQAIGRIYRALLSNENIVVYGDFDCDGITSTVLLTEGLTMLGGKVTPYIPHRLTEGYGLKIETLEKLSRDGTDLIITCDCGITAIPEVKRANKLGLDIIITDHHMPLEELPSALAVINPKRADSGYFFPELAGVGVALKLIQALFQSLGREKEIERLLDLVALGTVADMVPLLGENRLLVKQGLAQLNNSPRLGIREILTQAKVTGTIDTEKISWVLAPRLNTPGRLEHAMASYQLLTTTSSDEAREITNWLERKNIERQKLTTSAQTKARQNVLADGLKPVLFVEDPNFPVGINGLVANRLTDEFYRPAIIVRTGESWSTGSCRSIPEFNIINALKQCQTLLSHFGGHAQAAGFTIPTRNLPQFKQNLIEIAGVILADVDLRPHIDIDAIVTLPELINNSTFNVIQQLAPFGKGNPIPTFLTLGVSVVECRTMGANDEHLRMKFKQNGVIWEGVGFGLGDSINEITTPLDIVYTIEMDHWNSRETLRLNVLDIGETKSGFIKER
jgi:single-stranded-DNA-specific exonuclease